MSAKKLYVKVWRDIVRQKWQFLALLLILVLGIMIFGATVGMIGDVRKSVDRTFEQLAFQDFVLTFEGTVPQEVVDEVAQLENVRAVTGRLVMDTGLYLSEDKLARARLVGMPVEGQPPVNQLYIRQGRYLQQGDSLHPRSAAEGDGLVAVLDAHLADYYGYGPGTVLHPLVDGQPLDVEVVGVSTSAEYLMAVSDVQNPLPAPSGFAVLFMPQERLQALFGATGAINELNVLLEDNSQTKLDETIAQVRSSLGDLPIKSVVKGADNPAFLFLKMDLEGGEQAMGMVPLLILVVAALSIYVTLSRMVQAQRPQIGVMKAMGYGQRAIMGHYMLFSGLLALIGSTIGIVVSYPVGSLVTREYAGTLGLPFIVTHFHAGAVLQAVGMSLFFCLLAGVFPAWSSARIAPAQAMRFDPSVAVVKGSVPLLERVMTRLFRRKLKVGTRIALRNVFRNRRRTLTTSTGFVFALMILLTCWAMFDAMNYLLELQFQQVDRWDLSVMWMSPQPSGVLDEVASWEGVQQVEPIIAMPVTLKSATRTEESYLTAIDPQTRLHGFRLPKGKTPDQVLAPGRALLSPILGESLEVKTGDQVTIQTPFGSADVVVDTSNEEVMGASVYVNLAVVQAFMDRVSALPGTIQSQGGQFNGLLLKVDPSQQRQVRKALYNLPGVASVILKEDLIAGWRSLFGLFYFMMGMFLAFALIMAAAVIFNTMTVNVLERQREIATMRTLGQSRRRLTDIITRENLIVAALSVIPGLLLGYVAAYYIFQSFQTEVFTMPFYVRGITFAIVTVLIVATALLSQIPGVRRVNRLDLAEATKVLT
jgi:putative ABC transport system permease protein